MLKHRNMYKLKGSKMRYGVWDAKSRAFIGVVRKNGFKVLDTQYEKFTSPGVFGQVYAVEDMHIHVKKSIKLKEFFVSCKKHNIPVVYATLFSVGDLGWIHDDLEGGQCEPVVQIPNRRLMKFIKQGTKIHKFVNA